MGAFDFLNKTPGQLAKEAAIKAGKKAGGAAKDAANRRLTGTHNVKHPCGGRGKHLGGCDGDCHETLANGAGGRHSGEIEMSHDQYARFLKQGGSAYTASKSKKGHLVHVKKYPKNWKP